MFLDLITKETFYSALTAETKSWQAKYLAMYSTQWKGFVIDPALMLIPADDHLVHRGDGVFDVMRCLENRIYQLEAHLKRLDTSAAAISLVPPAEYAEIGDIIKTLIRRAGEKDCLIRVTLSRGPGGYTTNPFECPASQLYVNILRHPVYPDHYFNEGIPIITSQIPTKRSFFATIKSCNYLQNVLMKMEAVKAGCQYAVGLDDLGNLAEGSTENIGIVTREGILKFPEFETTLAGVTVQRALELAKGLVAEGLLKEARFDKIPLHEAYGAAEMFLTGTSFSVLPVVRHDGRTIGEGKPGPVARSLLGLLEADARENSNLTTEVGTEPG
jgi:branched-chain amino acid aminotransferase